MKNLSFLILIFLLLGCSKEKDLFFHGQVVDIASGESLNNITVKCRKYEHTDWFTNKLKDSYTAVTDENGNFVLHIDDYDNDKYVYTITANDYHDLQELSWPTSPGCFYSYYSSIENFKSNELKKNFKIELIPASTIYFYFDTLKYSNIDSLQLIFNNKQRASWIKNVNSNFIGAFGVRTNTLNTLNYFMFKNGLKSKEYSDTILFTSVVLDYTIK